jgi:DNA-binding NtrC family response regulator
MKVLIADDNYDYCTTIADIVRTFGYEAHTIQNPSEVISYLEKQHTKINIILFDIEFGPDVALNGIDLLEHCRRNYPAIPVIMISGKGTIEMAVQATKLGAMNFVEKNVLSREKLKEVLESAVDRLGVQGEAREICKFLESQGLIGKSRPMIEMGDSIIRFGRTDLNVMVTGETGTGKKLVAKALHNVSRRARNPIITVDIPNIPRELFQSELFGHNKGSFSGASETKKGLFHQANNGTLFLDEIGDLSLELQSSLFLPIEEKSIRRVGSTESEDLNVRFISATDKDLIYAMKESKFREQLYHRLRECEIHIPPLRDRTEDIPDIVEYYLHKHNHDYNDSKSFSPSAVEYLQEQSWNGNVRELYSSIRVVLQTASGNQIEVTDLHKLTGGAFTGKSSGVGSVAEMIISSGRTLKEDLATVDKKKIETTLERTYGNVSKAAAMLDISRETLHNKIRRYGINTQIFRLKRNDKEE